MHRLRFRVPMGPFGSGLDQETTGAAVLQCHTDLDGIAAAAEPGGLEVDDHRRMLGDGIEQGGHFSYHRRQRVTVMIMLLRNEAAMLRPGRSFCIGFSTGRFLEYGNHINQPDPHRQADGGSDEASVACGG